MIGTFQFNAPQVTLYEHANFQGQSRVFSAGQYTLTDFNDIASSIQVPDGLVAIVYEHADAGGGFGISADFLEDCADLAPLGLNDTISYISVFASTSTTAVTVRDHTTGQQSQVPQTFVWARGSMSGADYVPGHWERPRAHPPPPNHVVVVSPPLPPHGLQQPVVTTGGTPAEPASSSIENTVIPSFSAFTVQPFWDQAVSRQMGVIGSDYRGSQVIGSAAFERGSNNLFIPDSLNFWYPQKQPNDHRASPYFKRTISGTLRSSHVADISGTFEDHDLNIDIEPADGYGYLITDGHEREYTDIMSMQWTLSAHQSGQPNCDDSGSRDEFTFVECEIDSTSNMKARIDAALNNQPGRQVCAYGPWIYDKGHCCHPEIHPAEQLWWSEAAPAGRVYFCYLLVDESKRFWWRDQMDDGTKLKPWGAPPLTGTFALAFETAVNSPAIQFELYVRDVERNQTADQGFARHHLVYGNTTLVSVVQDPASHLKVTFEQVGLAAGGTVRGFVVLEATVGTCVQKPNPIPVPGGAPPFISLPPGTDVDAIDQRLERAAFTKEAGHLDLMVAQGIYRMT